MKTVDSIDFKGKKALVRVDFNVPLDKKTLAVTDDARIRATVPTLQKILNDGGSCILMSHLGRPLKKLKEDGTVDFEKHTLKNTLSTVSRLLGVEVKFADDCVGEDAYRLASELQSGEVLLLENLRYYKEEEKGDLAFAEKLAKLGDVYVNDAFGTAHRAHASTAIIAQFFPDAKCFGYVMAKEVANAEKVIKHAERPFTAITGGAKVSDKLLILENLIEKVDNLIIGGGMAYTLLKAQGYEIGKSLVDNGKLEVALEFLEKAKARGVNFMLPTDIVICDKFSADATTKVVDLSGIPADWEGIDIGPNTRAAYALVIAQSKLVVWNGPMGVFEIEPFSHGTRAVAEACAATAAYTVIGGGDSAAAVEKFGLANRMDHISTGGGASLEFMEGKALPGVVALQDQK